MEKEGAVIQAYDPQSLENARKFIGDSVALCEDAYAAVDGVEAVVLATEWVEFINLDWQLIRNIMSGALIVDGRNALDRRKLEMLGFQYLGVGQGADGGGNPVPIAVPADCRIPVYQLLPSDPRSRDA